MAVLLTQPRIRFLDSNGAPLAGGKIYTYIAGTTTPQATYTNAGAGTPNANPVVLDSAGYADIWITGAYKIVVQDSAGNTISTTDNITAFTTGAVGATFLDGSLTVQNTSDPTKQFVLNLAGIGAGTTITGTIPNGNFTFISPSIAQTYTAAQRQAVVTLTDGATITPNFALGNNYQVQLGGNRTIANPTNIVAGQSGNLAVYQDATGSRTLSWGWGWVNPGGSLPTLQTAGGSVDELEYIVQVYNSSAVTITIAIPGVVTFTNHGFLLGQQIQITTTGALPTGLTASTTYYVVPIDANTFSLATTLANAAAGTKITTTGSQSGVHTLTGLTIALSNNLTAGSELVLLATATASASSTLNFTSAIASGYSQYKFVIDTILHSTTATLNLKASVDNGGTWTASVSWQTEVVTTGGSTALAVRAGGSTPAVLTGNNAANIVCGHLTLTAPQTATGVWLLNGTVVDNSQGPIDIHANSSTPAAINAIQFLPSAGTLTSGKIYMYGVKNT
jgi:hypothetical protein